MNNFPLPILKQIYQTVESARAHVREKRKDSELHFRLREASETLIQIIRLEEKEDIPFWYTLYDGIIGRYIKLRTDFRNLLIENKAIKQENKELKEKYWDAIKRLEPIQQESEKW